MTDLELEELIRSHLLSEVRKQGDKVNKVRTSLIRAVKKVVMKVQQATHSRTYFKSTDVNYYGKSFIQTYHRLSALI